MKRGRISAVAGCARFPALDSLVTAADRAAPFPALIPLDQLLGAADRLGDGAPPMAQSGQIAALNARAARLRGPVIPPDRLARLRRGIGTETLQALRLQANSQ